MSDRSPGRDEELVLVPRLPGLALALDEEHGLHGLDVRTDDPDQRLDHPRRAHRRARRGRRLVRVVDAEVADGAGRRRRAVPPAPAPGARTRRPRPGRRTRACRGRHGTAGRRRRSPRPPPPGSARRPAARSRGSPGGARARRRRARRAGGRRAWCGAPAVVRTAVMAGLLGRAVTAAGRWAVGGRHGCRLPKPHSRSRLRRCSGRDALLSDRDLNGPRRGPPARCRRGRRRGGPGDRLRAGLDLRSASADRPRARLAARRVGDLDRPPDRWP